MQLRFDIPNSSLPPHLKQRLLQVNDRRLTQDGVWIIKSQEFRTQARNQAAALERLVEFVRVGVHVRKKRIATKPSQASIKQRLEYKKQRGQVKRNRRSKFPGMD